MKLLAYNIKDGAVDSRGDRLETVAEVVRSSAADLACLAECGGWSTVGGATPAAVEGSRRFHRFERLVQMRGLLLDGGSGSPVAVFYSSPWVVESAVSVPGRFFHAALAVSLTRPGRRPLLLISAHLDPFSATGRRAEAEVLAWYAEHHTAEADVVIAGDLNSVSRQDLEDGFIDEDPPEGASLRLLSSKSRLDSTPLTLLKRAMLNDCYRQVNPSLPGYTDPTSRFREPGEPSLRIDFVLASPGLSCRVHSARVMTEPPADAASDHYPVLVEFTG